MTTSSSSSSSSSSASDIFAPATKRARLGDTASINTAKECPICIDQCVPPVLLHCGHFVCGPCLVELIRRRQSAATKSPPPCPTCRTAIAGCVVPHEMRRDALEHATDEQRAADALFIERYNSGALTADLGLAAPPAQPKRPRVSRPNVAQVDRYRNEVVQRMPKNLTQWQFGAESCACVVRDVFGQPARSLTSGVLEATRTAARTAAAQALEEYGVVMRAIDPTTLELTLPLHNIERFTTAALRPADASAAAAAAAAAALQ